MELETAACRCCLQLREKLKPDPGRRLPTPPSHEGSEALRPGCAPSAPWHGAPDNPSPRRSSPGASVPVPQPGRPFRSSPLSGPAASQPLLCWSAGSLCVLCFLLHGSTDAISVPWFRIPWLINASRIPRHGCSPCQQPLQLPGSLTEHRQLPGRPGTTICNTACTFGSEERSWKAPPKQIRGGPWRAAPYSPRLRHRE